MSRIRRAHLVVDPYFQIITVIAILTVAMVLEELNLRPGDLVRYECPQCGRRQEQKYPEDPKQPICCDIDPRGRRHPTRMMTPLAKVKRT
jgi:hypothetical protein